MGNLALPFSHLEDVEIEEKPILTTLGGTSDDFVRYIFLSFEFSLSSSLSVHFPLVHLRCTFLDMHKHDSFTFSQKYFTRGAGSGMIGVPFLIQFLVHFSITA